MVITMHLLPNLLNTVHPRIIFIGSSSHLRSMPYRSGDMRRVLEVLDEKTGGCSASSNDVKRNQLIKIKKCLDAYATSKYNLMVLSTALQTRLRGCDVSIHTIHPGIVDTPMLRGFFGGLSVPGMHRLLLSPRESAWNVLLGALYTPVVTDNDLYIKPSYIINRKPTAFFTARSLISAKRKEELESMSELCFKEFLQELPIEMRCDIVHSLKVLRRKWRKQQSSSGSGSGEEIDSRVRLRRQACIDSLIQDVESIR